MIATVTSLEWYRRHFLVMSLLLLLPLSLCGNELFEGKHNNIYSMCRPCSLQISMHVIILIGKLTLLTLSAKKKPSFSVLSEIAKILVRLGLPMRILLVTNTEYSQPCSIQTKNMQSFLRIRSGIQCTN